MTCSGPRINRKSSCCGRRLGVYEEGAPGAGTGACGHHARVDVSLYCWTVTSTSGRPSPRRASRSCPCPNPSHPARSNPRRISRHPSSRFMRFPSMNGAKRARTRIRLIRLPFPAANLGLRFGPFANFAQIYERATARRIRGLCLISGPISPSAGKV
jgi:hypothetical protein